MGCRQSSENDSGVTTSLRGNIKFNKQSSSLFKKMCVSNKEAILLYNVFYEYRNSSDDRVYVENFRKCLRLEQNLFSELLFSRFAITNPNSLTHLEFMCSVWNYLSFHGRKLGLYLSFLFDVDDSGKIPVEKMRDLLEMVKGYHLPLCDAHDEKMMNRDIQSILHNTDIQKKGYATTKNIISWCNNHGNLFETFWCVQNVARKHVVGEEYWLKIFERRQKDVDLLNPSHIYHLLKKSDEDIQHGMIMKHGGLKKGSKKKVKKKVVNNQNNGDYMEIKVCAANDKGKKKREKPTDIFSSHSDGSRESSVRPEEKIDVSELATSLRKANQSKKTHMRKEKQKQQNAFDVARRASRVVGNFIADFNKPPPERVRVKRNIVQIKPKPK